VQENLKELLGDDWTPARVAAMMTEADTKGDGRIGACVPTCACGNVMLAGLLLSICSLQFGLPPLRRLHAYFVRVFLCPLSPCPLAAPSHLPCRRL
jgi:hypothetical protein